MRILQVIHQFPPHSSQGSEVYCLQLSKWLRAHDEVRVFHVSNTPRRRPHRTERHTFEGLQVYHCIDGGEYARVANWPNAFLREQFRAVLKEYAPEIVHFHNYVSLGDELVSIARAAGARVVYTLHDFGLVCPNTLLLRTDGRLCDKADPEFFQHCCPVLIRENSGRTPVLAGRLPSLARWRLFARQQVRPSVRATLNAAVGLAERLWGDPATTKVAAKREFYLSRTRQIFRDADLFLAPSEFLRQKYISCGVPREKIRFARYGMRAFERVARPDFGRKRIAFGYIGALHAHKGVELLINAFRGLGDRAELHVFGSAFGSPISEAYWKRITGQPPEGVTFHGQYDNGRIGEILAKLDAVVVPSVWFENSPLTIQEAFIAGVPVVTADQGGMAELVQDGVNGVLFRLGDADDLRSKLSALIDHPEVFDRLRAGIPAVPDIETEAAGVRRCYAELVPS